MRPIPVYERKKNTRAWIQENKITIESYFEDAVHFIILTLKADLTSKTIRDISVQFLRSPYPDLCPETSKNFLKVVGLKIEKGFSKAVSAQIEPKKGCTHILELLKEAADAFVQSVFKLDAKNLDGPERRKILIQKLRNTCLAYSDEKNI